MLMLACCRDSVELQASYDTPGSSVTVLAVDNLLLAHHPSSGRTGDHPRCKSSGIQYVSVAEYRVSPHRAHTMVLCTFPPTHTPDSSIRWRSAYLPWDPAASPQTNRHVHPSPAGSAWSLNAPFACLRLPCSCLISYICCQGSWTSEDPQVSPWAALCTRKLKDMKSFLPPLSGVAGSTGCQTLCWTWAAGYAACLLRGRRWLMA